MEVIIKMRNVTSVYKSQREIVEEILEELKIKTTMRKRFHDLVGNVYGEEFDRDKLYEIIVTNRSLMN